MGGSDVFHGLSAFREGGRVGQEIMIGQKCGPLKEVGESCEWSSSEVHGEKGKEGDGWVL